VSKKYKRIKLEFGEKSLFFLLISCLNASPLQTKMSVVWIYLISLFELSGYKIETTHEFFESFLLELIDVDFKFSDSIFNSFEFFFLGFEFDVLVFEFCDCCYVSITAEIF
jgi:hypothetical protein